MARLAVEAVVEWLEGEPGMPPRDILLDSRLVVRGTTGPAPARLTQNGWPAPAGYTAGLVMEGSRLSDEASGFFPMLSG